jgi:hypothetical protein
MFRDKFAGNVQNQEQDAELDQALKDFRLSVHAWSDAAFSRPRTVVAAVAPRHVWRLAAGWALGCFLVAGGVSAGFWQHHQRQVEIRLAAARVAEQQRLVALRQAMQARQDDEDLLAKVDSDISREVPAAMEPLAQLMVEDTTP